MSWKELHFAPKVGTTLCRLSELADGDAKEFTFGEGKRPFRMFLVRWGNLLKAYLNSCPHFQIPLNVRPGQFFSTDRRRIMCYTHYAMFEIEDGYCVDGPCQGAYLESIPLKIIDDLVIIG